MGMAEDNARDYRAKRKLDELRHAADAVLTDPYALEQIGLLPDGVLADVRRFADDASARIVRRWD